MKSAFAKEPAHEGVSSAAGISTWDAVTFAAQYTFRPHGPASQRQKEREPCSIYNAGHMFYIDVPSQQEAEERYHR